VSDLPETQIPTSLHRSTSSKSKGPGGLILTASFAYMQDPRETKKRRVPIPRSFPTFETLYHFHTTVVHYGLHAMILHDDDSFNETFVNRYSVGPYNTSAFIKFVRVEAPSFSNGEPIISPNDFRYVAFNNWLNTNAVVSSDGSSVTVNGYEYEWLMVTDLDVFFQRNPFPVIDEYAKATNLTFIASFDGGLWEDEQMRLQRKLFRNCYGRNMILRWTDLEWKTENGNCGLWAAKHKDFSCILSCMSQQYDKPPVQGKGKTTICDMAVHDWCVHYGGCFPGSSKGVYDRNKVGVLVRRYL